MECFFDYKLAGCVFDSSGTAAWVQAIGTLFALGVAIYAPIHHQKNQLRLKKLDQAERINQFAEVAYKPIKKFQEDLRKEMDPDVYFKDVFRLADLSFFADQLDQIQPIDYPSPDLIRHTYEFKSAVRLLYERLNGKKHLYMYKLQDLRDEISNQCSKEFEQLDASIVEIRRELERYQ